MIIGIDIDDTISDTFEIMFNLAHEFVINDLKRDGSVNDDDACITHHYIENMLNFTESDDQLFLERYYEQIITEVKPKTLALKYLQKLHDDGHKIILITARWTTDQFDVIETTKRWLEKYNVAYDKLVVNAETKLQACQDNNVDCFIDDSFANCTDVSKSGIKTYIMNTSMNRKLEDDRVKRVYSWAQLYHEINK